MSKLQRIHLLFLLLLSALGCMGCSSEEDMLYHAIPSQTSAGSSISASVNYDSLGRINAVKKAYQMTDIEFTPLNPITANSRTYQISETYKGLIYSSVKEIGTYVGRNVSFHTFMTAIHNPRSKIYTEQINKSPYHGTNCKAYYGTVCSGLVSYALGISNGSYDFPNSSVMVEIDPTEIDSVHVADVLWKSGHVALITDISKDTEGKVTGMEICEAVQNGCRRYSISESKFHSLMTSSFKRIYRYTELYKNTDYTPAPEFVAVMDETPIPFVYNDDLCADKGDKACYLENEKITINIMHDYEYMEIYKDNEPYMKIDATTDGDVVLENLPYGDYKANICYGPNHVKSDFTYWKVVNIELLPDRASGRLYFRSANAVPTGMSFSNKSGSRSAAKPTLFRCTITDRDRANGYIEIPQEQTQEEFPYINFYFSTDYGKIKNKPISWFDN